MVSSSMRSIALYLFLASASAEDCLGDACAAEVDEMVALQKPKQQTDSGGSLWFNTREWEPPLPPTGDGEIKYEFDADFVLPNEEPRPSTPGPDWGSPPLPELNTVSSENGILETTFVVSGESIGFPGTGLRWNARVYNNSFCGPLIRVKRSDRLKLTVINKLGVNGPKPAWLRKEGQVPVEAASVRYQNVGQVSDDRFGQVHMKPHRNNFHEMNTTNFHMHGLHVSPAYGQDNVVDINIYPEGEPGHKGEHKFTYDYEISSVHMGGTQLYHAHWHGSSTVQVGSGLAGGFIVDYEKGEVPDVIYNMPEVVVVMQEVLANYVGPNAATEEPDDPNYGCWPWGSNNSFQCALQHRTGQLAYQGADPYYKIENMPGYGYGDNLFKPIRHFFTANGVFQPTLKLKTGEWKYVRWSYPGHNIPVHLALDGPCEWQLVAKDGILLNPYPRKVQNGFWPGPGNRVDFILRCTKAGKGGIRNDNYRNRQMPWSWTRNQTILHLEIEGSDVATRDFPGPFTPQRARYASDLMYADGQVTQPKVNVAPICPENTGDDPTNCRQPFVEDLLLTRTGPKSFSPVFNVWMSYDFPGIPTFSAGPNQTYIVAPVRYLVNNETFRGVNVSTMFQATQEIGKVTEFQIGEADKHAWHMHETPVQLMEIPCADLTKDLDCNGQERNGSNTHCMRGSPGACNGKTAEEMWGGYFREGDWHDTIMIPHYDFYDVSYTTPTLPATKVRFLTDCYTGLLLIHCHVLHHEDQGMMFALNVTGEDYTWNEGYTNDGVFQDPPARCLEPGAKCAPDHCGGYKVKY